MKLREVFVSPRYYSICECDRTEGLVVHVVAGGVLMYDIVVELLPDEEAEFRREGHLDRVALDIARNESKYRDRRITPAVEGERLEIVERL